MAWDTDIRLRPGGATPADQQVYESDVAPVVLNEIILRSDEATPNDIVVSDPAEISGTGRTGTGSVTQAAETCSGTGNVTSVNVTGTGAFTQAAQSASGTATEEFSGSGAVTQAAQTASGSGTVTAPPVTGTGACEQAAETIAGAGYQVLSGAGSGSQAAELCSGAGFTGAIITGTGSCTQAAQTCDGSDLFLRSVGGDGWHIRRKIVKGPKWKEVYVQYAKGELHSGSVDGPIVEKAKQGRAIAYSVEKKHYEKHPVVDTDEMPNPFNSMR